MHTALFYIYCIEVLEEEYPVALDQLAYNQMFANSDFHSIFVEKDRSNKTGINLSTKGNNTETEPTVKLFGVKLDNKLNCDSHFRVV